MGLDAEYLKDGKIPFFDAYFPSAVLDNVLEHVSQDEVTLTLREVLRVLQTGGTLLIGVLGLRGYESDNDHKHFYTENELITLLSRFGCVKKKTIHMPFSCPVLEKYLPQYCIYVYFEKTNII